MQHSQKPKGSNKVPVTIRLTENIVEEVKEYCRWAGIKDRGFFYTEAVKMVFAKDKDWQAERKKRIT